jgi:SAM-dependent methyltransferase
VINGKDVNIQLLKLSVRCIVEFNNIKIKDVSHYDHRWATHVDIKKHGPYARHVRRLAMSLIRSLDFDSLLDVGCGPGFLIKEIYNSFQNVELVGTDISPIALRIAKQRIPDARFELLDISTGSIDQKFDLVTCMDVIEHIEDDNQALRNLSLMTNKYLIIGTIQGFMRKLEPIKWGHVRNYTHGELVGKIEQTGMSVLRVIEWGYPFYSPIYRDFIDLIGEAGVSGKYGLFRKLIAKFIYLLFLMNSHNRGDVIIVLSKKNLI